MNWCENPGLRRWHSLPKVTGMGQIHFRKQGHPIAMDKHPLGLHRTSLQEHHSMTSRSNGYSGLMRLSGFPLWRWNFTDALNPGSGSPIRMILPAPKELLENFDVGVSGLPQYRTCSRLRAPGLNVTTSPIWSRYTRKRLPLRKAFCEIPEAWAWRPHLPGVQEVLNGS